jgi:hypothetical protein
VGDSISHSYLYATLWSDGNAINLNDELTSSGIGWTLQGAQSINDFGQIVGYGINPEGALDAFLLTPCLWCGASAVPEPSTWAMMLIGFAGLGFAGFRRAQKARMADASA